MYNFRAHGDVHMFSVSLTNVAQNIWTFFSSLVYWTLTAIILRNNAEVISTMHEGRSYVHSTNSICSCVLSYEIYLTWWVIHGHFKKIFMKKISKLVSHV